MADEAQDRPRLTIAMIVRNAAGPLRETIASVQSIADEIVVLDTGSTDDTIPAAQQLGANVYRQPWDDDFATARNACLAKTTGDWILWLDTGEQLAAEAAGLLREFIDRRADATQAYLLPVVLPPASGEIGGEQVYRLRLHPLEEGVAFAGRVRERLDASLAAGGITPQRLEIAVLRSPRDHEPAIKSARAQRNIRLADLALAEEGPSADMHNCLGEALQSLGDPLRAAQQYQRALRLAESQSREALEAYYGLLTCLNCVQQDRSTQLTLCMEAIEHFPLDAQLLVAMGGYLQALEQPQLAARSYDVAFRHGQTEPQIWHLADIQEIAACCTAAAHQQMGAADQARTLLEAAVRVFPNSVRLAQQLQAIQGQKARSGQAWSDGAQKELRVDATQVPVAPPANTRTDVRHEA